MAKTILTVFSETRCIWSVKVKYSKKKQHGTTTWSETNTKQQIDYDKHDKSKQMQFETGIQQTTDLLRKKNNKWLN